MNVCTIIAKNYLAHARVLADSLREHHPDATFTVLVIDDIEGYVDPAKEPFRIIGPREIGLPDFDLMATRYDVLELSTAVKPWLLQTLLAEDDHVVYLDPDIRIFGPIGDLAELARAHDVVLTPHTTAAMPRDGRTPAETDILIAGAYNLGFVAMGASEQTRGVLDWWSQRLETDCIVDPQRGYFVDQRWMDFVPGMVDDLHILRDEGYNVAYWNLPARTLAQDNGHVTVNGRQLRFFHFSGFDADAPHLLSKHQNRISLVDDAVLEALCRLYGEELRARGYDEVKDWPYTYARTASGIRLDRPLRRLHGAGQAAGRLERSVFDAEGEREFLAWIAEPAEQGGEVGINRYMRAIWEARPDVQAAYPDPEGDAEGLQGWFDVYWRPEAGVPEELIPRTRHTQPQPAAAAPAPDAAPARPSSAPLGVNVVGYLRSELGVGEVARQAIGALDAVGVPVLPIGEVATASRQGHDYVHRSTLANPFAFNLLCVNADQTEALARRAGEGFFADRHTIGWWWWEVDRFPPEWEGAFEHVDELWAGSRFIAENLGAIAPVPVRHMPLPVAEPLAIERDRTKLHLPAGTFVFLYVYDYNSVAKRKNPLGVVEAFKRAFPEPGEASLVLKCINADAHAAAHEAVRLAVAGRPDISIMDWYVTAAEKNGMIAACDAYVSLHRSEGFGITMAEAMLLGKPVIATGYSGNADFVTPETAWPVDYELVAIGEGSAPYPADGHWAEPDLDHAARCMREVFGDPAAAAARAQAGAAFVREHHSPHAAGMAMAARLEELRGAGRPLAGDRPASPAEEAIEATAALVRRGPAPALSSSRPARLARRAVLRLIKPYTAYRRQLDDQFLALTRVAVQAADAAADEASVGQSVALAGLRRAQERNDQLGSQLAEAREQLRILREEARARPFMEGDLLQSLDIPGAGRVLGWRGGGDGTAGEDRYAAFEDVFRGSEELIRGRQRVYLGLLGDGPVLDIGSGRGEFLDLAREAGLEARGIDMDAGMVRRSREKGHDVEQADALEHLDSLPDGSLGAVVSFQVVEHIAPDELQRLIELASRKLRPGGVFIAETVNPHWPPALKAFWVDPTHRHPIFPEVLLVACRAAGFGEAFAMFPNGTGDWERDIHATGEYAVVARVAN